MITREFNLNLNAGRSTPLVIFANQFNSDEQWVFTLFDDNGQQYIPSSGSIVGIKADGLGIINSATVTAGKVVVDVTEQITASAGISEFELSLDNGTHGTANFKVVVEKKPSEGAEYSDSDISLIQEALDIVNPLPTGGTAGQVLTKTTNGSSWQDAQAGLPSGGTTGQVLTKTASGSAWQNAEKELPTGGSAGQVLTKTASGTTWSSVDAFPSEGTTGQVLTKSNDGVAWTDAGNPTDTQVATAVSDWLDENITPTTPAVDATLTITGAAADAKKTGDEISALKSQISSSTGMSAEFKTALENLVNNIVFVGDDPTGQTYIDALHNAMYPPANLSSISAVYSGGTVYDTATLNDLKSDLVVTAYYDNETSEVVDSYTLSGDLVTGTNTITVMYGNKTATFDVVVVETPFSGNRYVAVANETLSEGYINDNGEQSALANSYYIDKLYNAVPFALGIDGAFNGFTSSLRARMAYYDNSESFLSRNYQGSGGPIVSVADNNAVYQKVGWTSLSPNYVFLLEKDIDESSFVNADVTLDANGDLASKSGASTTDFIAIETGVDKFILLPHTNTTKLRIAFYDVNQTFISRFINFRSSTANPTYYNDIPTNAKYYRLTKESSDAIYQPAVKVI